MDRRVPEACDVLVVGAGPAGSSAARVLREAGLDTLLVDRCRFPRAKTCDGVLLKEALDLLEAQFAAVARGLRAGGAPIEGMQLHFPDGRAYPLRFSAPGLKVRREEMDLALARASGARFLEAVSFVRLREERAGVVATVSADGEEHEITSRYLVGADGAASRVLKAIRPDFYARHLVPSRYSSGVVLLGGSVRLELGWWHSFFVPGAGAFNLVTPLAGSCEVEVSVKKGGELWRQAGNLLRHLEARGLLDGSREEGRKSCRGSGLASRGKFCPGGGRRVLLAGDAAGLAFWLGMGIPTALASGRLAGEAIVEAARKDEDVLPSYRRRLAPLLASIRRQHSLPALLFGDVGEMDFKRAFRAEPLAARVRLLATVLGQLSRFR